MADLHVQTGILEELLQSIPDGIFMFNPERQVTFTNVAAMKLTGLPREGFYLSEFVALFAKKSAINFDEVLPRVLKSGETVYLKEVSIVSFFYELIITPIHSVTGAITGGAIIIHDVTDQVALDQRKSEFVSLASHQLRTPLSIINWYVEMLIGGDVGPLTPPQKEHLDEVYKGSARMAKLVNDLLNLSRLETGRLAITPVPTDLVALLKNINDEVGQLAKARNCAIVVKEPIPPLPKISVDPELARQVFSNIIVNAIRYSPPEKKCTVTVGFVRNPSQPSTRTSSVLGVPPLNLRGGDDRRPPLKIRGGRGSYDNVIISIKDEGIGIPKDAQARVFEKFFRADNARTMEAEGSGLGLYIAKLILEASGGTIWFSSPGGSAPAKGGQAGGESSENPGTTFYVAIPMAGMRGKEGEKGLVA